MEVCLEFQSSYYLCPGASESCLLCPSLSRLCWQLILEEKTARAVASSRDHRRRLALGEAECATLWDWAFLLLGTMGGFHGWLIPESAATTAWEKQSGVKVHACPVGASVTAQRQLRGPGWAPLISPKTEDSVQPAVGYIEQLKGCEKIKGAGLAFLVWKMLLSALNWSLEL